MSDNKVETELLLQIKEVLLKFPKYWEKDVLLRNKVAEDLRGYNQELIEALLSNQLVKDTYSITLNSTNIFKIEEFISMLRYKNYWENSYTKYSNEIGLTSGGKYLNYNTDVVLDFPHKDSVLEGGMTKEDQGKKEIYYHNVLAKEEIDTLLSPKVLTNLKKYDKNSEHDIDNFTDKDNLIIKGNNLIAIETLKERYADKINVIYIDPPYNTGGDANIFTYNNTFNHSTWLTFIKNRIESSYELLREDGFLLVAIDDAELFYLGVLIDEIYGKENFIGLISVVHKPEGRNMEKFIATSTEYMLVYAKNKNLASFEKMFFNKEVEKEYMQNRDEYDYFKPRNYLRSGGGAHNLRENKPHFYYPIYVDPSSLDVKIETTKGYEAIYPITSTGQERTWKTIKKTFIEKLNNNRIIAIKDDNNKIQICEKYYRSENGELIKSHWIDKRYNAIHSGTRLLENIIDRKDFSYPKSLYLVKDALEMTMGKEDIVLDFFGGSGTTAHAVLDLNNDDGGKRRFIMCEQLDEHAKIMLERNYRVLKKLDSNDSFIYTELYKLNDEYVKDIQQASNEAELEKVLSTMKENAYLNFKVDLERVSSKDKGYNALSLEEKKEVLIQVLDMNQLYLSYSEMEDEQYKIPEDVKAFNHSFYQKEGVKDE